MVSSLASNRAERPAPALVVERRRGAALGRSAALLDDVEESTQTSRTSPQVEAMITGAGKGTGASGVSVRGDRDA